MNSAWRHRIWVCVILLAGLSVTSCKPDDDPAPVDPAGKVVFHVEHQVDGSPLQKNSLIYTNAAGNQYMVNEVMYFISDITFHKAGGTRTTIGQWDDIFYIDDAIPATQSLQFFDPIPSGNYDSVSFTFGISAPKNISFIYVNPPEVNMSWPEVLGGGYHYMMINGKWKDPAGYIQPFDFHLGIGQLYHGSGFEVDSIYAFVQNYFEVTLPGSAFAIHDQEILHFDLIMNIDWWFSTPHTYDHNVWGGAIMQNQAAMQMVKENGTDVFTFRLSLTNK
jgi:hypothetical protein